MNIHSFRFHFVLIFTSRLLWFKLKKPILVTVAYYRVSSGLVIKAATYSL